MDDAALLTEKAPCSNEGRHSFRRNEKRLCDSVSYTGQAIRDIER